MTKNKLFDLKIVVNKNVSANTAFLVPPRKYLPEKRRMETDEELAKRSVKIKGLNGENDE